MFTHIPKLSSHNPRKNLARKRKIHLELCFQVSISPKFVFSVHCASSTVLVSLATPPSTLPPVWPFSSAHYCPNTTDQGVSGSQLVQASISKCRQNASPNWGALCQINGNSRRVWDSLNNPQSFSAWLAPCPLLSHCPSQMSTLHHALLPLHGTSSDVFLIFIRLKSFLNFIS